MNTSIQVTVVTFFCHTWCVKPWCTKDMTNKSPLDFFNHIIENIVDQTNLYAEQYIRTHPNIKPCSRIKWKALTVAKFLKFFALIVIMGINRLPKMEDHWSTKWPLGGHESCQEIVFQ